MKHKKKLLSAAITLSLVLGVYGVAGATDLWGAGTDSNKGTTSLTGVTANKNKNDDQTYVTTSIANAATKNSNFTVTGGEWGVIQGGYSNTDAVHDNNVTISGGTIKSSTDEDVTFKNYITGGTANKHDAYNNTLTISGNTTISNDIATLEVVGGHANYGQNVHGNTLTISDGTFNSSKLYGGKANSDGKAYDNTLTISGGTFNSTTVYGGHGTYGSESNHVYISGGTFNSTTDANTNIYGGFGKFGSATNNDVNISDGTITGNVYGGYGTKIVSSQKATSNTVNISGGTITGNVYGGYSDGEVATGNTVTISGGTITGNVYGGYSDGEAASSNTVNVSGTADLSNAALYGYNNEATSHEGNTLTIESSWTGTVKSIQNFDSVTNNGNLTVKSGGTLNAGKIVAEGDGASIIAEAGSKVVVNGTGTPDYIVLAQGDISNHSTIKLLGDGTSITATNTNTNTNGRAHGVSAGIGSTIKFVDGSIKVTGIGEACAVTSQGSANIELGGNSKTVTLIAISTSGEAIGLFETGKIAIDSGATINVALQAATGKSANVLKGLGNITNSGTLQLYTIANDGTVSLATAATGYTVENFSGTYTQTGANAVTDFSQMDVNAKGTYNIEGGEFKANKLTVDNNKTFTLGTSASSAKATITGETVVQAG